MATLAFRAIILAAACATAAPLRSLNQKRIHGLYHDGDFDRVIKELDGYVKGACACSHGDSVFAEKHLAVVYAANPTTRELGRYHMYRLLDMAPNGDLLDMFVGEEVDAVFDKVRKEHDIRAAAAPKAAQAPAPSAANAVPRPAAQPLAPARTASAESPRPADAAPAPAPKPYSDAWTQVAYVLPQRPAAPPEARKVSMDWAQLPERAAPAQRHAARAPEWSDIPRGKPAARSASRKPAAALAPASRNSHVTQPAPSRPAAFRKAQPVAPAAPAARPAVAAPQASRSGNESSDTASSTQERPAWKQAGLWIGGGAALAAVAFTFIHAGNGGSGSKTYAVPASISK